MLKFRVVWCSSWFEIQINRGRAFSQIKTRSPRTMFQICREAIAMGHKVEHFLVLPYVPLAKRAQETL